MITYMFLWIIFHDIPKKSECLGAQKKQLDLSTLRKEHIV